jgi:SAM-dependent methyltransferase
LALLTAGTYQASARSPCGIVAPSMTPLRHPGAPRLIEWTGERCVPWTQDSAIVYEHFHRYLWAASMLAGRKVLDLGSGEGFGAAILASSAAAVTGVDVDDRAVEHARASYAGPNLRFETASALDLSGFEPASFDAVVAFEMIEHVEDHARLMSEVGRVMSDEGVLVVSTPDKDLYSEAAGQSNAFHEHELTRAEFAELLHARFEHVAMWGQRTVAGSLLTALQGGGGAGPAFFLEPRGGEWEVLPEPEPLFCVALASRRRLPDVGALSALADTTLELRREAERAGAAAVAERDGMIAELNERKRAEVLEIGGRLQEAEKELLRLGDELWQMQEFARQVEESVTWQAFQRARTLVYGAIGEETRLGRGLSALLRWAGRPLSRSRD